MFKRSSLEILKLEFLARLILLVVTFMSLFRPFLNFIQGNYYAFAFMSAAIFVFFSTLYSVAVFSLRLNALAYYNVPIKSREKVLFKPFFGWFGLILWLILSLLLTSFILKIEVVSLNNLYTISIFSVFFLSICIFNPLNLILNLIRAVYSLKTGSQKGKIWILLRISYICIFLAIFSFLAFSSITSRFFYFIEDFFILINLIFGIVILDAILAYFENRFLTKDKNWLQSL